MSRMPRERKNSLQTGVEIYGSARKNILRFAYAYLLTIKQRFFGTKELIGFSTRKEFYIDFYYYKTFSSYL